MVTYQLTIQSPKPDEDLSRLVEAFRQYCDSHQIGYLYSFMNDETGQAMAIPNPYFKAKKPED